MSKINEPIFTKAIKSSAFQRSQLAEKATTRVPVSSALRTRISTTFRVFTATTSTKNGRVVAQNVEDNKDPKPRGTVFRGAPMPYFLRVHGGIGMHAGYLPGYPASHGCIRLPKEMALKFFEDAPVGTPVEIR
jgi:hypothetical protein